MDNPSINTLRIPKPSRQGHRKSRQGCLRCKYRRVKCNEEAPCHNCFRRGETCSLVEDKSKATTISPRDQLTPFGSESGGNSAHSDPFNFFPPQSSHINRAEPTSSSSTEWLNDLYLMHNFTSQESYLVTGSKTSDPKAVVWCMVIPELATQHPFLMHGLLAFSAANLQYRRPEEARKWALIANDHQNLALPEFRQELSQLSTQNCKPLFVMATLCAVLSMSAISQGSSLNTGDTEASPLDAIVQMLVLSRGLWASLATHWQFIMQPPLDVLTLGSEMADYSAVTLPQELNSQLQKLRTLAENSDSVEDKREAYLSSIQVLEHVYKDVLFLNSEDRDEVGIVMKLPVKSQPAFISLIDDRDPIALVVLVHYIVLMGSLGVWFADGFRDRAWQAIKEHLPITEEISRCLAWPIQQMESDLNLSTFADRMKR